ncbi:hypothetical protein HYU10_03660 [Candidatus Woesearchaeota archaeon]|nr:hypothetical protein [Candidatus Woesearchaeota archaeon]MBI2130840.1 hypothetical protein [Candidatus Woesearchaeota archaeon]MBI2661137.1 hypothetical protein [Candidatus Woesearchaeota archaeon]
MADIKFSYQGTCGFSNSEVYSAAKKLAPEIQMMNEAAKSGNYNDERSSINLPADRGSVKCILELAGKFTNAEYVVVIGIGGSNLGAMAVFEAIKGRLCSSPSGSNAKMLFADTVDPDSITGIGDIIRNALKSGKKIVINAVTKSGTTTETIANFLVLLDIFKRCEPDYRNCIVITTDRNSKLWEIAVREKLHILEIPGKVGGRYSVFSAAGLFPLKAAGINVSDMLKGAIEMRGQCLSNDIEKNPAALSAAILYLHYRKGIRINDSFFFANDLESAGKWYRQLMGESVGKKNDLSGRAVNAGITPTVSIGSTDLHSMAQLYLGGPYDKYTTFTRVQKFRNSVKIPSYRELVPLAPKIQEKGMTEIMDAILKGVQAAFRSGKRPYSEVMLPEKSERYIGQLLQFKMIEMMYLGSLLEVNPFDQPNVEDYKKETRKILGG